MKKGKKIALFVSMVLVLAVAAVLNVLLLTSSSDSTDTDSDVVSSFFATSREDRLTTRTYEIEQLDNILALEGDEYEEARANALEQKMAIVEAMDLELLLETLLKAQGYDDVYVAVSTTSDTINVIVSADSLEHEDTVRIYNIIATETSVSTDYVSITCV